MVLEARPLTLDEPLAAHRHLRDSAGRDLTKAAIEDIVVRGDIEAWRGLVQAARRDTSAVREKKKAYGRETAPGTRRDASGEGAERDPGGRHGAALHAGHRISFDHDHILNDLASHYDEAIAALESIAGWRTKRRIRGKLVLDEIGGIEARLPRLSS